MNNVKIIILSICIAFVAVACKVSYSFTGGTLSTDVKTFSVQYFPYRAPLGDPKLSNDFTEALKEKFRDQTSLNEIVDGDGHLNFEGEITGFSVQAKDITANDIAATNRLTITVKVRFTNEKEPKNDFDKSFSATEDYSSEKQLTEVQGELVPKIFEQIINDVYNEAVVNW